MRHQLSAASMLVSMSLDIDEVYAGLRCSPMGCRSCGAEITDAGASFCSRCGAPVREGAQVTERIRPQESSETQTMESGAPPDSNGHERPPPPETLAGDMLRALRRIIVSGGWPQTASAAALGFAATLTVGGLLVLTWKLAFPDFASGEGPVLVLTYIVIAGLMCLGVPIEQGGAGSSLLPLGALALVLWVLVLASRRYVGETGPSSPRERAWEGARLGLPFAVLCFAAALIFRARGPDVGADPALAFFLGGVWGSLSGAIGGVTTEGTITDLFTGRIRGVAIGSAIVREGLIAGEAILVVAGILGMAAVLLYLIAILAVGSGVQLTGGEALAILAVVAIFAPNLAAGTVGFSLGAPNVLVARSFDIGFERQLSLLGFGDANPAPYLYLLLIIPMGACLFGGYLARRRTSHPATAFGVLGTAASVFALSLAIVVYLGTLDYSAGVLGAGALVVLRPDAASVFLLALLWAGAIGYAGWRVAEAQLSDRAGGRTQEELR
jgi:hypothetical protein